MGPSTLPETGLAAEDVGAPDPSSFSEKKTNEESRFNASDLPSGPEPYDTSPRPSDGLSGLWWDVNSLFSLILVWGKTCVCRRPSGGDYPMLYVVPGLRDI